MRKLAFWSAYFLLAATCAVAGAELILRYGQTQQIRFWRFANERICPQWSQDRAPDPFSPPFPVFADTGERDRARLSDVAARARYPRRLTAQARDFLRAPAAAGASRYAVAINSDGLRDVERSCRKPLGVRRVIALGDYMTFGQGVAAPEAFPARLEALLNRPGRGPRVEVWNAGRQAATALVGLALLEDELWACRPDALIVAYGFVDAEVLGDDWMPMAFNVPSRWAASRLVRRVLRQVAALASRSELCHHLLLSMTQRARDGNVARWERVMDALLDSADRRGVPVVMLDHFGLGPPDARRYQLLAARHPAARFLSIRSIYERRPPSDEQKRRFAAESPWTGELPFAVPDVQFPSYRVDLFHPNRWGHEAIAEALAEELGPRLRTRGR